MKMMIPIRWLIAMYSAAMPPDFCRAFMFFSVLNEMDEFYTAETGLLRSMTMPSQASQMMRPNP